MRELILIASAGVERGAGRFSALVRQVPLLGDRLKHAIFPRAHRRGCKAGRGLCISVPGLIEIQKGELDFKGFVPRVLSSMRGILTRPQEEHRTLHRAGVPVLAIWGEGMR